MSEELRKIKVSSGNIQVEMEVTQEAYSAYMRPWWEMKQKAKRNRDAIEKKGYSIQSYEEWQDGSTNETDEAASVEEQVINKEKLACLQLALAELSETEKEIAIQILTGDVSTAEYARKNDMKRTTVSDKKKLVLQKLQRFFKNNGYEIKN